MRERKEGEREVEWEKKKNDKIGKREGEGVWGTRDWRKK